MNLAETKKRINEIITNQAPPNYQLKEEISNDKKVIIYSAGVTGKLVYELLKHLGYEIVAFLDIKAKAGDKLYDINVFHPDKASDEIKKIATIISLDKFKYDIDKLVAGLKQKGYRDVSYNYNVMCQSNFYHFNRLYKSTDIDLKEKKLEILKAVECLGDEHSINVFIGFLEAYALSKFDNAIVSEDTVQYISPNLEFAKGFSTFIDCGAYIGDTFEQVIANHKIENYIAFEPTQKCFDILSQKVDKNRDRCKNAILYPCGVSDRNDMVRFDAELDGGSSISEQGKDQIQIVAMDMVLKVVKPTMIKMDIEGAEMDALAGCKKLISENLPDLSICVYHKLSDLWEIPLYIHDISSKYRFYMRAHNIATLETVLYATT